MSKALLSLDDFTSTVTMMKSEVGEPTNNIDFAKAYASYKMLSGIFGTVNLEITDRGDRKRVEMLPRIC